MPSHLICPECGGVVGTSTGDARLCLCSTSTPTTGSGDSIAPGATSSQQGAKTCCACGKNVAGQKRMRDRQGRYWCFECGQEDSLKRDKSSPCHACGKPYPASALTTVGADVLCPICHTQRLMTFRGKSGNALGSGSPRFGGRNFAALWATHKRILSLIAVAAALALATVLRTLL